MSAFLRSVWIASVGLAAMGMMDGVTAAPSETRKSNDADVVRMSDSKALTRKSKPIAVLAMARPAAKHVILDGSLANPNGIASPDGDVRIVKIERFHSDGSREPLFSDDEVKDTLLSTDAGFILTIVNATPGPLLGFVTAVPLENLGMFAAPGAKELGRRYSGSPQEAKQSEYKDGDQMIGLVFPVPPGQNEFEFPFSREAMSYGGANFFFRVHRTDPAKYMRESAK